MFSSNQKNIPFEQLFRKAADYCAQQERCELDITTKLYNWNANKKDIEKIIKQLKQEDFLNETRYAQCYTSGKFRINKWGKRKIEKELTNKRISNISIANALNEIDESDYINTLQLLIEKRIKETGIETMDQKMKIVRFLISRGYETHLIFKQLNITDII